MKIDDDFWMEKEELKLIGWHINLKVRWQREREQNLPDLFGGWWRREVGATQRQNDKTISARLTWPKNCAQDFSCIWQTLSLWDLTWEENTSHGARKREMCCCERQLSDLVRQCASRVCSGSRGSRGSRGSQCSQCLQCLLCLLCLLCLKSQLQSTHSMQQSKLFRSCIFTLSTLRRSPFPNQTRDHHPSRVFLPPQFGFVKRKSSKQIAFNWFEQLTKPTNQLALMFSLVNCVRLFMIFGESLFPQWYWIVNLGSQTNWAQQFYSPCKLLSWINQTNDDWWLASACLFISPKRTPNRIRFSWWFSWGAHFSISRQRANLFNN